MHNLVFTKPHGTHRKTNANTWCTNPPNTKQNDVFLHFEAVFFHIFDVSTLISAPKSEFDVQWCVRASMFGKSSIFGPPPRNLRFRYLINQITFSLLSKRSTLKRSRIYRVLDSMFHYLQINFCIMFLGSTWICPKIGEHRCLTIVFFETITL